MKFNKIIGVGIFLIAIGIFLLCMVFQSDLLYNSPEEMESLCLETALRKGITVTFDECMKTMYEWPKNRGNSINMALVSMMFGASVFCFGMWRQQKLDEKKID